MSQKRIILWFRQDLRIHDNEALVEAAKLNAEVIPIFVFDDIWFKSKSSFGFSRVGKNRREFINACVKDLEANLKSLGLSLITREGNTVEEIFELAKSVKSNYVFCNRERTTEEVELQEGLEKRLWSIGQELRFFRGKMLIYTSDLPFPITHVPDNLNAFKKEVEHLVQIRQPLEIPEKDDFSRYSIDLRKYLEENLNLEVDENKPNTFLGGETRALALMDSGSMNSLIGPGKVDFKLDLEISALLSQGCLSPKTLYFNVVSQCNGTLKFAYKEKLIKSLFYRDFLRLIGKKYGDKIFFAAGLTMDFSEQTKSERTTPQAFESYCSQNDMARKLLEILKVGGFLPELGTKFLALFIANETDFDWRMGAELFEEYSLDYDPCSNWVNWQILIGQGPESKNSKDLDLGTIEKKLKDIMPAMRKELLFTS